MKREENNKVRAGYLCTGLFTNIYDYDPENLTFKVRDKDPYEELRKMRPVSFSNNILLSHIKGFCNLMKDSESMKNYVDDVSNSSSEEDKEEEFLENEFNLIEISKIKPRSAESK
jgi:hypothetical protein